MFEVSINVNIRFPESSASKFTTLIEVDEDECVKDLMQKLLLEIGDNEYGDVYDASNIRLIFSGNVMDKDKKLRDYDLASSTALTAMIIDSDPEWVVIGGATSLEPTTAANAISSFYGHCKHCDTNGYLKLRVKCIACNSNEVRVQKNPSSWEDIKSEEINCYCFACDDVRYAKYYFKCNTCTNQSIGFENVNRNEKRKKCVICGEIEANVVKFTCAETCCLYCFEPYLEEVFERFGFSYRVSLGFTLNCPVVGCCGCIGDQHVFYILGNDRYNKFQELATQRFIQNQQSTVFCPFPDCGEVFTLLDKDNVIENATRNKTSALTQCHKCERPFCVVCIDSKQCTCYSTKKEHSDEEKSKSLIHQITKKCVGCGINTQKDQGCNHIHCTQCSSHWCWVCLTKWNENCQFNHWF
uniref:E3 ubiquitin-protein ligase parkin n=1 Tax=Rhabditophanes sp. KR3021 TaxID=114890 RepID=A0AC35U2J3_9BILA